MPISNWWFQSQEINAILSIVREMQMRQLRMEGELKEALQTQHAALQELTNRLKASSDALKQVVDTTKVG